jgi:hypothetical protein
MQTTLRLDDLVLDVLTTRPPGPAVRPSDVYHAFEIIPADADDDVAMTHRFERVSPYERIELSAASSSSFLRRARPTTFVKTVRATPPAGVTLAFDKVWFEQPDDAIAAIEDMPARSTTSWLWLALSLLAGAIAIGVVQYVI